MCEAAPPNYRKERELMQREALMDQGDGPPYDDTPGPEPVPQVSADELGRRVLAERGVTLPADG